MNFNIKKFEELTLKELYNIIKERTNVFVVEQNCPYPECDDKDIKSYHLFLEENDDIIAYLRVLPKGVSFNEVSIGRVLVNKKHRNKGLARELVAKAIKFINEEIGDNAIKISAQEYVTEFYQSFGFKSCSEVYLEDNIPHRDMLYVREYIY